MDETVLMSVILTVHYEVYLFFSATIRNYHCFFRMCGCSVQKVRTLFILWLADKDKRKLLFP